MITMHRIVVPIDFSEYSKKSLRYATEFAVSFQSEILLVYVIEPIAYPADFSFGQIALPMSDADLRQRAEAQLQRLIDTEIQGRLVARAAVRAGKPSSEIVQYAKEEEADLIIIATHGHSGVEHVLFGSTAERVIRKAPCPVLSIRDKEKEFISITA
jgi:universal stress protein A